MVKDWRMSSRNHLLKRLSYLLMGWAIALPILSIIGFYQHTLTLGIIVIFVPALKSYVFMFSALFSLTFASDMFAGEKERKTIESFLALPCAEQEIFLAKILVPTFLAILAPILFLTPMTITMGIGFLVTEGITVFDAGWYLTLFVLSPLAAFANAILGVKISARFRSFKTASNISGFVALPTFLLLFITIFLPLPWDIGFILILIVSYAVIDVGIYFMSSKGFDREKLILDLD